MVFLPSDIAVVIPARAGSKRLKNKNRSQVGGISLLQRANLTLTSIGLNGLEIFTTDDQLLHEEAKKSGLFTPNLRPPELSHDDASTLILEDKLPVSFVASVLIFVAFLRCGPIFGTLNFSWSTKLLNGLPLNPTALALGK